MKMTVAGVQRVHGTSGKGSAFDMCNLIALVPVEAFNNGKVDVSGAGFKVMELPLDHAALPHFLTLKYPCGVELLTEPRPRSGKLETVVVGMAAAPSLSKAA